MDGSASTPPTRPVELLLSHGVSEVPAQFILPPHLRPHRRAAQPIQIPIIDLALLEGTARPLVLEQIHRASCEWGFFQLINHGVSLNGLHSLRDHIQEFLALPTAQKCELGFMKGDEGQGFGTGFVNPKAKTVEWKDYLVLHTYPPAHRDYTKWPPCLREDVDLVGGEVLALAKRLLAILSENLQLAPGAIEDAMDVLHQKILIAHYPPCPNPELAMGSCEHTDVGVITCVWQATDDVVALQVCKDGKWHSVEPHPGAIVVNVGDQLEIFSNGLYKSGPHRVVLNSSKSRLSVVAFHNPSAAALVSPASSLVDDDRPSKYQPTFFKSYAADYFIKAV